MWRINVGLCLKSIIGISHGWFGWAVDSSTMDMEEVDDGGEGGSFGSTMGAACGDEGDKEVSSLEEASWACLNFSKSDRSSSILDNSSAIVGPKGDCGCGGWPGGGRAVWDWERVGLALYWACCDLKCTSMLFWYSLT